MKDVILTYNTNVSQVAETHEQVTSAPQTSVINTITPHSIQPQLSFVCLYSYHTTVAYEALSYAVTYKPAHSGYCQVNRGVMK